ncbi:hypothetical protein STRDD11_00287 [Streptococcus sp. DD11]|nr:hypothetical protein STRDD11_00287 [Streptococcus sp. DD11]
MKEYSSRQELIDSIEEKLGKYLAEFEDIPEDLKHVRAEG